MARLVALGCLLVLALPATADERASPNPMSPAEAAAFVLEKARAKDHRALVALLHRGEPDPWLVVDALCARNAFDAALALAEAAPRTGIEKLAAYVVARRLAPTPDAVRRTFAAVGAAMTARDYPRVLTLLEDVPDDADTVVGVRLRAAKAIALRSLDRMPEAQLAFDAAASATRDLGWLERAELMYHHAGRIAFDRSDWVAARAAWTAQVALLETLDRRKDAAQMRGGLGPVLASLGDHTAAVAMMREGLETLRELGDLPGVAATHVNLGNVLLEIGDHAAARVEYRRGVGTAETAGHRQWAANGRQGLAALHSLAGDYGRALLAYEDVLEEQRALGNRIGVANTLANIANVHLILGDPGRAAALYEDVLKEQLAIGDRSGAAQTHLSLARVASLRGDHQSALRYDEQAAALFRSLGDRRLAARALSDIASDHEALGDSGEALTLRRQALAELQTLGDRVGRLRCQAAIASLQLRLGQHAEGRASCEHTLELLAETPDPITRARILQCLATLEVIEKRPADALRLARESVRHAARVVGGLADEEGARARDLFADLLDVGVRAAHAARDTGALVWFLEQGRASSLREGLAAGGALETAALPKALRKALTAARLAESAALDALRRAPESGRTDARATWEAARTRVQQVGDRVQREAKVMAAVGLPDPDPPPVIAGRLRKDEALVLYDLHGDRGLALVVEPSGARFAKLPAVAEIRRRAVALLRSGQRSGTRGLVVEAGEASDTAAETDRLRALLVGPLRLGKYVRRLLVSPVGPICYVPFSLLLPGREIAYIPSATAHGLLLRDRALRGADVLAVGDPEYAGESHARARTAAITPLQRLPATRGEVEAVGTTTLLGADASEAELASRLAGHTRWRAVHFACHGLVDPDQPMLSALALTADETNDGLLTALEIFGMRIPADLVVLSACETGTGKVYATEGIVGLTRAFMYAGTPRVLCSLWKVDDEATKALMVKFYELWNPGSKAPGLSAAAALTKAQAYVQSHDKWKHPYYWAAWVLWGLPD